MLIDEQFRKCAAFLCVDADVPSHGSQRVPAATATFVSILTDGAFFVYAVTNRHVVYQSRRFGSLYIRFNVTNNGRFVDVPIDLEAWHENYSSDVAVALVALDRSYDVKAVDFPMLASDDYVEKHRVGVGDDVFFAGLFSEHPGVERSQPIIRFGNISMMPHEKIYVQIDPAAAKVPIDAYLVEARSWGGHSGSPTFIYYPPDREAGLTIGGPGPAMLGLVTAHFPIPDREGFFTDSLDSTRMSSNAGIAVVVPAQAIIDLLLEDDLVEDRRRRRAERRESEPGPMMDSGPVTDSGFERFQKLTRNLVAVPKSEIDSKKTETERKEDS